MNIRTSDPIDPADLSRTLVQTQIRLRRYIATHYRAADLVIVGRDDPYGMVDNVLTAVLDVLWKQERCVATDFFINDDRYGRIGIGRVDTSRPSLQNSLLGGDME